jgi:hypothetical protein
VSIAIVLHLVEDALRAGEVVGDVEIIETGENRRVRSAAELLSFLRESDRMRPADSHARTGTVAPDPDARRDTDS